MKRILYTLIISTLCVFTAAAQIQPTEVPKKKFPFVNITEIGGLLGRVKVPVYGNYYYPSYSSYYPGPGQPNQRNEDYDVRNTVSISVQTFNGVYIDPKTAVGFTTGMDWYNNTLVTPMQLGIRRNLVQRRNLGAIIYAGLDAGYGTTWLNADEPGYKAKGGLVISPTIGYKMPTRGGSAWVINFGYKHQTLNIENIRQADQYFVSNETRNHNRVAVRFGFEF